MAMIAMNGCESGSLLEWTGYNGVSIISSRKRSGSYAIEINNPGNYVFMAFASKSEIYMQVGFYLYNLASGPIVKWTKGATVLGTAYYDNALKVIKLYTGDSADLVATGTKVLSGLTWYVLELRIKISDTVGVLTSRIDGIQDATFSGDTKPGADTEVDRVYLTSAVSLTVDCDDFIVNDTTGDKNNSWPTAAKVILLKPTGAGSSTQWTPSAGANYQCVDEVPPTDTDKITTNVDAKLDLYALEDLPAEASGIAAVQVNAWALKSGVPAVNNLKLACRTHSTNYLSDGVELGTTMALANKIWEKNPNTNAAWTIEEVNAMEAGVQAAA